jgi:molecular chaperone IbpA
MNANITDAMLRYGIGLNPLFFERERPKFPPHNITEIGDSRYRLTLAVAGYSEEELKITLQGEKLTIHGIKPGSVQKATGEWVDASTMVDEPDTSRVLYRGIALRNFNAEFLIGQHVKVDKVKLRNGLLDIDLIREVPESQKLKEIPIST